MDCLVQPTNKLRPSLLLSALLLVAPITHAYDETLVENPSSTFHKDSFVVTYTADDFSDKIDEASILYIPQEFGKQAAFFFRCRPYYTNFSVQFTEQQSVLADDSGRLQNDAQKFDEHGYIYNAEHDLELDNGDDSEEVEVMLGGQNKHLTRLFKTDTPKTDGLLGMSFHFTFNYTEMPSFRNAKNSSDNTTAYELVTQALKNRAQLKLELEGEEGPDRTFTLDTARMADFVPAPVIEFCLTQRKLLD